MDKLRRYLGEERGRMSALAAVLKISPSAISMWDQVPTERLGAVAQFTGIPPEQLRPDLASIFASPSKQGETA